MVQASLPVVLTNEVIEPFGFAELIVSQQPTFNASTQKLVEGTPTKQQDGGWVASWSVVDKYTDAAEQAQAVAEDLARKKVAKWEPIKAERDRRRLLGVRMGDHWFHSDDSSRIQQLALAMMGASLPAGLKWKTLTLTDAAVFVEMTPAIAQGIFQAAAASDAAIFAAAEAHRVALEASANPESYDFSGGWPVSIHDAP